jgi:hypothetical protein
MRHKRIQESVKPVNDFFRDVFAFLPGVVGVVTHEQFPVKFFCFFHRPAIFKIFHFEFSPDDCGVSPAYAGEVIQIAVSESFSLSVTGVLKTQTEHFELSLHR